MATPVSDATVVLFLVASAGIAATIEELSFTYFGVPRVVVTAAASGALLPTLLLDREPLWEAIRRWIGSTLFGLLFTAAILHLLDSEMFYGIALAAALSAFARDLMALLRGELPPMVTWFREKWFGNKP